MGREALSPLPNSMIPSQLWPVEDPSGRTGKQENRKSFGNDYCEDI